MSTRPRSDPTEPPPSSVSAAACSASAVLPIPRLLDQVHHLPDVSATTLSPWTIGCQPGGMSALLDDHVEQHGHLSNRRRVGLNVAHHGERVEVLRRWHKQPEPEKISKVGGPALRALRSYALSDRCAAKPTSGKNAREPATRLVRAGDTDRRGIDAQTASQQGMCSLDGRCLIERHDDQRLRWSEPMWSPPPESNRRPHPYHGCALPTELGACYGRTVRHRHCINKADEATTNIEHSPA